MSSDCTDGSAVADSNRSRSSTQRLPGTHQADPLGSSCKACTVLKTSAIRRGDRRPRRKSREPQSLTPPFPRFVQSTAVPGYSGTSAALASILTQNEGPLSVITHQPQCHEYSQLRQPISNATIHFARTALCTTESASKPLRSWPMSHAP